MPSIRMIPDAFTLVSFLAWVVLCSSARAEIDFNRQVRPILAEYCFHCHGPDSTNRAADLRLDREEDAKISAIVVGPKSDESPLLHRIHSTDPDSIMPPVESGKILSDAQKALLKQWLSEGGKYSDHWSFRPIENADRILRSLPDQKNQQLSPIDRFVSQKLAAADLSFSKEINRSQFIRRASFDLTGLPPTWEEVEAFEKDRSEDCYEKLIDRLLESPRYGERWGRHWLDIARYADTLGGAAIGFTTFPFSYTYRDYVIRAFNDNIPFDRFIVEQIAADQLGLPEDDPALAAIGFLTVGMQFRNYHDTIDDQIDVITRGLMGLTVACARCHDHKFDAIPTQDYYSLYAAIAPSKAPNQLPVIGRVQDDNANTKYQSDFKELNAKLQSFVREQSEVMRGRLRMQASMYLSEIAKGTGEQDLSTQFLSYRTDDIRPLIINRWRSYFKTLPVDDAVFGPFIEMQSWGNISEEAFSVKCEEYVSKLKSELGEAAQSPGKLHALGGEPPKWNPLILDAILEKKPASLLQVAAIYGNVFADQQRAWLQSLMDTSNEASAPDKVVPDDHPQHQVINSPSHRQLRNHLYGPQTPFDLSDEEAMRLTNRTINDLISAKRGAIHQLNLSSPGSPPRAMILKEDPSPKEHFVFLRGNPLARGTSVRPRFLSIVPDTSSSTFEDGKRRLGLAKSVVAEANPLTPRVLINWAWQNHFGVGLVRTPDDFGTRGQPPTHPELLDYLADEFRRQGWSLKWLHKQIMLSHVYRQGAIENEASRQKDPENQWLWRMPRRRLDFEAMRDAMLAVSKELDVTMGGRPIDLNASPTIPRRSVYGFTNRDIIANLMSTFDAANPNSCTAKRPETTVPQQTLFALNSDFIQDRAMRIAGLSKEIQSAGIDERVAGLFQRILGRYPTALELERARGFVNETSDTTNSDGAAVDPERKWNQLAHALLASNEFIFLD